MGIEPSQRLLLLSRPGYSVFLTAALYADRHSLVKW